MICSKAEWVELFVAGRLDDSAVRAVEAHVEECEECFLRVAAGAGDLSGPERLSLSVRASTGGRTDRYLRSTLAASTLRDRAGAGAEDGAHHTVGPYRVTGFLGMGGMSIVYRAKHGTTGREVALKTVRMPRVASYLGMLRQEIEFLQEARHPGIVTVLEADLMAGDPWYAMELFDGPTLEDFNRRIWRRDDDDDAAAAPGPATAARGPATAAGGRLAEVLRLFAQLCAPVGFIHGSGMVHGDIKPSNVFLRGEQPVLMDFGLVSRAKGTVGRETLDVTGRIRGTLPYIAPETIRGQIPDARADLYALGCMLYESLVGKPPFVSRSGTRIIDMHLAVAPDLPSARVSGVPPELDQLLARLLAKNPRERFGHASALATTLRSIADALTPAEALTPSSRTPPELPVVSSETTLPLFRPPLVGRDAELATILEVAHRAGPSSSGAMFLVSGESGIGKTFFTGEVAQRALLAGIQVITGECVPLVPSPMSATDVGTLPLQPLRRFFQTLRDRCRERGQREIDRLFGPRLDLLAAYLPNLAQLRRAGELWQPPPPLPAAAARERIVAAVVDTIAIFATGRPVLLALDDLQWADELTLAVLDHLDQDLLGRVPLVVVGTYRGDEAGDALTRLGGKPGTHPLRLGRLGRPEIATMVGGMLSMSAPPEPLVDYVHAHAEGVPFFVAEYLRALVANGILVCRRGAWTTRADDVATFSAPGEGHLPRTLQDLIRGRLGRLPPDVLEVLEAGALIGRRFSASLLGRMLERPVSEVAAAVGGLGAAQVTDSDGFDGYTFLHDKIRETLYAGLAPERRQRLHLAAARALEEDQPPPPDRCGPIGHHLRQGGDAARAIFYLEKAGEHALGMAANADADQYLRAALELEATLPVRESSVRRARWQRQRGEALQGLGLMAESAEALKSSAELLAWAFPRSKAMFVAKLVRELWRQLWHRLRPHAIRRPTEPQRPAHEEVVRVFDRMHQASYYLGKDADLVLATMVSLNSSEMAGPAPSLAVAYTNAAIMASVLPLPALADRYFGLAGAAVQQTPDPAAESWLLLMEGAFRSWYGQRERAVGYLDRAIALLDAGGFLRRRDEAECTRIAVDEYAGFHREAMARIDEVERRARKRRDLQVECWAILQRVDALLMAGARDAAFDELGRARALLPTLGRPERIWATAVEAHLRHLRGEDDQAFTLGAEAARLISLGPPVHNTCVNAYDRLAETAVALCGPRHGGADAGALGGSGSATATSRTATARAAARARVALARRACAIVERAARVFPIVGPAAILHRGALDLILGRRREAVVSAAWQAGVRTAAALGQHHRELRLHVAILSRLGAEAQNREGLAHRQRISELSQLLEIDAPEIPTSPWPPLSSRPGLPLGSGVEIEGEAQRQIV